MRVEDLKNYGRGLLDSVSDPGGMGLGRRVKEVMREELQRELGHSGRAELMSRVEEAVQRMKAHDWSVLREHGLNDQKAIEGIVKRIALMEALAGMVGMAKASAIQCRLLDRTMYDLMSPMWPSAEDYEACGNFFESFKGYHKASMAANVRAGLHEIEWVEDSPTALAFDVRYCVWHEVAKAFGDPYLCYPSTCYGDEITIPRALDQTGYQFKRAGTMAQGASVCDFRYELLENADS
jgi:hypothetical protein